jgi:hypothetical protein
MDDEVQPRPARYMDSSSAASDPGGIALDAHRLRRLSPSLFGLGGLLPWRRVRRAALQEYLWNGDSRAAVVVSVAPLLVASYSDDFDAVVMLRFDRPPTDVHLEVGTRLLAVNTFRRGGATATDIVRGPLARQGWTNVHPVIADFVCADPSRVERRKATISEPEWQRTWQLGQQHLATRPHLVRDGAPHRSAVPAGTG